MDCKGCRNNWGINKDGKHVYCYAGTLVTGKVKVRSDKDYTKQEIYIHFEQDPMEIEIPEKCKVKE